MTINKIAKFSGAVAGLLGFYRRPLPARIELSQFDTLKIDQDGNFRVSGPNPVLFAATRDGFLRDAEEDRTHFLAEQEQRYREWASLLDS